MQHVSISHATSVENSKQPVSSLGISRPPVAPLDSEGNPLKTSVCDEIEESVTKASKIEQQLRNSKVNSTFYFISQIIITFHLPDRILTQFLDGRLFCNFLLLFKFFRIRASLMNSSLRTNKILWACTRRS